MPILAKMRELMYMPSNEIERQVSQQEHIWYPIPEDTKGANNVHWPALSFVGAYYQFISQERKLPTQEEYIQSYFAGNANSVGASSPSRLDAMRSRAGRNYRIYVCEHHLLSLCIESRAFELCYKSEELDLNSNVDMILKFNGYEAGIAVKTRGTTAAYWNNVVKPRRLEVRDRAGTLLWHGPIISFFRDTKKMKKISNLPLFREDAPSRLAGEIQKARMLEGVW